MHKINEWPLQFWPRHIWKTRGGDMGYSDRLKRKAAKNPRPIKKPEPVKEVKIEQAATVIPKGPAAGGSVSPGQSRKV